MPLGMPMSGGGGGAPQPQRPRAPSNAQNTTAGYSYAGKPLFSGTPWAPSTTNKNPYGRPMFDTATTDPTPYNPSQPAPNPIAQQMGSLYQSQYDALQQQTQANSQYNSQLGLLNQNQTLDNIGFANRDANLQKQALDVGQLQDVGLAGQRAQQAFDTAQTKFATDMAHINQQAGLTDAERAEKLRAAQASYQDTVNQLGSNFRFNTADLNAAAQKDQRLIRSDATGRGAVGSYGFNQGSAEIAKQLQSGLGRQQSNLDLGNTNAKNGLTASNNATELSYQNNQLQLQQVKDQAEAARKQATLDKQNSDAYLKTVADQYGIRQEQVQSALQRGLSQLGYDAAATTAQLANAQKSSSASAAAQAAALTASALQIGIGIKGGIAKPVTAKPVTHVATRYS